MVLCRQVKYSYLDIVGRTVVVLQKDNLVPTHNVPFQVKFTFNLSFCTSLDYINDDEQTNWLMLMWWLWQVYYTFKPIYMLAEPFMLVSAFFFVFVASLAYVHIDLNIVKK